MWIGLALAQAHAATLSGVVRDAVTLEPVAGIPVLAVDERLAWARATSTTAGRFTLTGLPPGRYRIYALPGEGSVYVPQFWPQGWSYCAAEPVDLGAEDSASGHELLLPRGSSLRGRLIGPDGAPVAAAPLICYGLDSRVEHIARETTSDAEGRFECSGLDAESGEAYALEVAPADLPLQAWGGAYSADALLPIVVSPGEDQDLGDWSLLPGVRVEGVVRAQGLPLAGAEVTAYAEGQVVTTITDDAGRYAAALPPGEGLVWASAEGHAQTYWPGQDRPTADRIPLDDEGGREGGVDLELPAEARLIARLEPAQATDDLSGAAVVVYNDEHTVGLGASMNADGEAVVGGLWGGVVHLAVYADDEGWVDDFMRGADGAELDLEVPAGGVLEVEVSLPRGAVLDGQLTDDRGLPVYGARVQLDPVDGGARAFVDTSDHNGVWTLEGVLAGRYTLTARYSAWCPRDRGWVQVVWPGEVNPALAATITLAAGQHEEGMHLVLPYDGDQDGMGDAWEEDNGLNPAFDDSGEDPDGDGFTNLDEYLLGTDPRRQVTAPGGCGCGGDGAAALALLALGLGRRRAR